MTLRARHALTFTRVLAACPLLAAACWMAVGYVATTLAAEAVAGAEAPDPTPHSTRSETAA